MKYTKALLSLATVFAILITVDTVLAASPQVERAMERECGYVLDTERVKLGKSTAYIPLDLEGSVEENFAKLDGAVCAFGLAYPDREVLSVSVDRQFRSYMAPVVANDKIRGLFLGVRNKQ